MNPRLYPSKQLRPIPLNDAGFASSHLDIRLQLPVSTTDHRSCQSRSTLRHLHLLSLDGHLRDAAMALELARPDIWPLWSAVRVARRDLQVPRAIVADEKAGDVLETVGLHGRMMLEGADLDGC